MKREEFVVEKYLKNKVSNQVIYEPDGNIPPDFLVDSNIAIEVRRLNQNFYSEINVEGLEIVDFPLYEGIMEVIKSFDNELSNESFYVFYDFGRPFPLKEKYWKKNIKTALSNFLRDRNNQLPKKIFVDDYIELYIYPSKPVLGRTFRLAGNYDRDFGGPVVSTYQKNLIYCIKEKSIKINKYQSKYRFWWLFLVDVLDLGLDHNDISVIKNGINTIGNFNKVVLLSRDADQIILEL